MSRIHARVVQCTTLLDAGKVLQQQMREADVNGDGKISWKEFSEYFSRMAQLKVESYAMISLWNHNELLNTYPCNCMGLGKHTGFVPVETNILHVLPLAGSRAACWSDQGRTWQGGGAQ